MNNKTNDFFINDVEATELTLEEKVVTQGKVLYEDVSKRGQSTKHFRLDNGNFMAVVYDHPVHKLDAATGKYIDISPEIRETENDLEANMNQFKVRFPKIDGKDNCITVSKNGREIAWKFIPGQAARRNKPVGEFSRKASESPWDIGEYPSVKYEKMDADTDLQYEVLENGIKESIILTKKPNRKTFTFQLMLKGLKAKLSEDMKTVLLFRSDEDLESGLPEMQIPPAFMEDKNGAYNDEIHYALREIESGTYLDLILETDWVFDSERVYPVVIDPRVEIYRYGNEKMRLVEVCSDGTVVTAADRTDYRRVGIDDCGKVHRLYIDFDLPELADGYKITQAGMLLYQKDYATYNGNVYDYIVAPVTDPNGKALDSSSFTWDNVQNLNIGSHIDILRGHARPAIKEINIDMTQVVENWYNSDTLFLDKRCVVVKKVNESSPYHSGACQATYIDLFSLHNGYGNQPKLYIEYTGADVYSDHQKYHTFENGRAGTGSVNLFTGKMSFAHGDVVAEGVKLPLAVSHLYRFEYIEKNANGVAIPSKYGIGWKLSIEQTLEIVDKHGIVAVYTDAQGKRHYFTRDETNTSQKITDDAGLGLTYSAECNDIDGHITAHILKDEKGNKMTFDSSGKLIQLIDTNGNVSSLEYLNGNLTSVIDGNHHSASLYYNAQNKLDCIVDGNGRAIYYTYDTAGDLVAITYPSADTAYNNEGVLQTEFVYDNTHRLTKVIDYSGIAYAIDYDGDRVSKLTCSGSKCVADNQVTSSSEEVVDNAVSFEYRTNSTAIVDDWSGIKTVYKFDKNGRELSSYVDMTCAVDAEKIGVATPTEIAGYASIVDNPAANRVGKYRSLSVTMNNDPTDEINLIKNGLFMFTDGSSKPTDWTVTGSGTVSSECYISGRQSYSFGSGSQNKYLTQTVNLCECELDGNVLVVSAWAKAYGNNTASADTSGARFRLVLQARYEDGVTDEYVENYDPSYHDWQYAAIPFVLNDSKRPVAVTVKLDFSSNYGTVYFTNVRLVSVDGIATTNTSRLDGSPVDEIYVFDECKAIKTRTVKKDSITTTTDYIDENSDIVRTVVADRGGNHFITSYKYDSKHNLIKTQDYRGLVIEYTYSDYGKELTRKTYHVDTPSAYMYSEHTYQEDNFVASESDPRYSLNGEKLKTTYVHDTSRNLLLQQTDVNGQAYNYTYDDTSDDLLSLSSTTDNKTNENQFFYTRGYLTRVAHNGFNFGFGFDELGRSKTVTVGDDTVSTDLLTTRYEKIDVTDVTETEYASGEKSSVIVDMLGNPITSTYTDKNDVVHTISNATYDSAGKVKQLVDNERGVCYNYTYDAKGNVIRIVEKDAASGAVLTTNDFVFDENERLTHKLYGAVNQIYRPLYEATTRGYIYPDNEVIGITLEGKYTDKVTKDGLRRAQRRTFTVGARTLFEETYGYLSTPNNGKTIETEIVSSVASHVYGAGANSETVNYTYDKAGNLETVSRGTVLLSKYYYDGLNRLKREDNHTAGKTYVWDYDVGGNLLFKKEYALCTDVNLGTCLHTKTYTYKTEGWRDRLDSYNGLPCVYDAMGNPTTYLGNTLTWTKVRRLASFGSNTFAYGANGIRYRKNNTVYTLDGNKILRESDGSRTITYYHGGSGIVGFAYNGTDYYFRKNLQGDVMEIYTAAGAKAASYVYDAWGKVLAVNNYTGENIGDLNPIRYRGYYYDVETGLYYLNSRYYDPETGRFINADTTDVLENAKYDINGLNLYAYCNNNPVAGKDDEGDMSFWKKLAIAAAVVVAVAVVAAVVAAATAATGGAAGAALCAVTSTFVGAAKGAAIGAITGALTGAATGAVQGAVEGYQETGTLEGTLRGMGKGAAKGAVQGAQDGLLSGMVMGGIGGAMNPSFCFVAGTTVLTTLGKKAIETVQVGDAVPCVDHITGEVSEKKVVITTVNKVDRLTELDIDGEIIQCTETHPFQVKGKGWVDACDLVPGDVVYTKDWNTATVRSVNLLELPEPVEVFNFEVEDCHTYFVGGGYFLVHNAGCTDAARKGIQKHKEWDYGQNNKTIFKEYDFKARHGIKGVGRADAVDVSNRIVYELKPNNPRAISQGWKQLNRYTAALEQAFPGTEWIRILITY